MFDEKVFRFSWKKLAIGSAAAFGIVVVVFALLYVITTPLSPSLAAEQYIEDRYDAVAEDVVSFALQERSLKTELVAEVGESITEQVVPYSCLPVLDWETVGAICSLSFRADRPMKVDIGVPVVVNLRPVTGLFGQRGAVAYDSSIIYDGLAVNIPALEQLEKVGEVAVEVADVAVDIPVLAQFERVGGVAVEVADVAVDIPVLAQFERVGGVAVEVADVAVDIPVLAQFERVGGVAVEVADVTTGVSGIGESVSWGVVDVEDFPIGDHSAILQLGVIYDDVAHQVNLWAEIDGRGSGEVNIGGTFQFLAFYTDGNSEVIHTALMPDIDTIEIPGKWFRYRPDLGWVSGGFAPVQGTGLSPPANIDLDDAKILSRIQVNYAYVATEVSEVGDGVSWGVVDVEDFPIGDHSAVLQLGLIHDDPAHKINLWLQSSGQGSVESNIAGTFQFLAFYTDGNSEVIHTALMPDIDNRQDPRWFRFRADLGWVGQANPPNANTPMSFASNLDLDAAKTLSRIRVNYRAP